MKLACASGAFDRSMQRGDLTQLEFIDHCARELNSDGVVLDVRHFPRTDDDYLAQVKKFATDAGVSIAAIDDGGFFAANEDAMNATLAIAVALGAPLVAASLQRETALAWSEQLVALSRATGLAKTHNITLALRNAPETFAATGYDCKRASKESDSAWLRYGLDPAALDRATTLEPLLEKTVLLRSPYDAPERAWLTPELVTGFRGHLVLDGADGSATLAEMQNAIRRLRIAFAEIELNRT